MFRFMEAKMSSAKPFICAPWLHSIRGHKELRSQPPPVPGLTHPALAAAHEGLQTTGWGQGWLLPLTTLYQHCLLSTGTLWPWASCNTSLEINLCSIYPCKGLGGLIAHEVVEKWCRNASRLLDLTIIFAVLFILTERSKRGNTDANLAGH